MKRTTLLGIVATFLAPTDVSAQMIVIVGQRTAVNQWNYDLTFPPLANYSIFQPTTTITLTGLFGVTGAAGPLATDFPPPLDTLNLNWSAQVLNNGTAVQWTHDGPGTGNFLDERHTYGFRVFADGATDGLVNLATSGFSRDIGNPLPDGTYSLDITGLVAGPVGIPEPGSLALTALGLAGLAARRARRAQHRRPGLRVIRLDDRITPAAGLLDQTFAAGGEATLAFPAPSNDVGQATAIDHHGRLVIAGYSGDELAVARYNAHGTLDSSFGIGGKVAVRLYNPNASGGLTGTAVAVDAADRVVVTQGRDTGGFVVARLTAAGALDSSFGGAGRVIFGFGGYNENASAVAIDAFGRIVVAGHSARVSSGDFAVARLTPDGTLDNSFNGNGKVLIDFGVDFFGSASAVAVDTSGRLIVAGYMNEGGSPGHFALARLTDLGALDTSFDGDGIATVAFGVDDGARSVAVDAQNRVVVAGPSYNGSNYDFALARLTTSGALDSTFNGDGMTTFAFGPSDDHANGVAVDSLGRVLVAGDTYNGSQYVFALARLTTAGALDPGFDGDGQMTVPIGSNDGAGGVAVDAQDQIVAAGSSNGGSNNRFAAVRLTAVGALDTTFGVGGRVATDFLAGSAEGQAVATDHHGRLVVTGYANHGSGALAVARYTADGVLDASFGSYGVATFSFSAGAAVAVDSLDRVIVLGSSGFTVARLTPAGALDTTFDGDGIATVSFGSYPVFATAHAVAVDSQDRVVIAGEEYNGSTTHFAVARLTTAGAPDIAFHGNGTFTVASGSFQTAHGVAVDALDRVVVVGYGSGGFDVARLTAAGALDAGFGSAGQVTIAFGGSGAAAYGVAIDSLSRVVVAGDWTTGSNYDFALARLTASGAPDTSFNGNGRITFGFSSSQDHALGVAVDAAGRAIVAGVTDDGTNVEMAAARLTTGGTLDPNYGDSGMTRFGFGSAVAAVGGVGVDTAGRAIAAGYTETYGYQFAVARLTGDTTTAVAQVNDGSAQRSMVTSLTVTFSSPVSFAGPVASAFTLTRTGGGTVIFTATASSLNGVTVVTLNNFTGSETQFGSLADGRYTLTALANQISAGGMALDGNGDGTAGGNYVFGDAQGLFRFFGDINGDQIVNGLDLGFFKNAFGTQAGDANYLSAFDFNGDGVINGFDFGQFRTRFGTMLP
jgi:uncharacterized delta-60 repeat protein